MSTQIKKLVSNGSYCGLPFVHTYLNLDGNRYLCCYSQTKINTDLEVQQLQTKILAGEKIEHCKKCYDWENQGSISPRIKETIGLLKNNRISTILEKSAADVTQSTIVSYDIRYDNRCNLACIGCNPKDSSLWARKLNVPVPLIELPEINVEHIKNSEKIYLAGGEPLISEKVYQLLSHISDADYQPEIVINSNIANIKPKFYTVLKKLKKLSITVSFDGAGSVNEYHRWPLQWDKFLNNLTIINNEGIYVSWNTVVDSVSVWGLEQMVAIESLTRVWNIRVLQGPPELRLRNLSDDLKPMAKAQLESLRKSKFYLADPVFETRINLALAELNCDGSSDELAKKIKYLDNQRNLNHQTYLGVKLT
jgi:MoaA/NifB/PqqE/SkfB family radical SAM enzyme